MITPCKTDELTTLMHAEFTVSEETERKHITWIALAAIDQKLMTESEAIKAYGVTREELAFRKSQWPGLND